LITDPQHGTPVQVNRNGERTIARGSRDDIAELELEFVPDTADIVVGDLLVSSGLGQRFPKDYPVAEVTSVVHDRGQPFAIIRARPVAQMDRTRHVMLADIEQDESTTESQVGPTPVWVESGLPLNGEAQQEPLSTIDAEESTAIASDSAQGQD
jgi:rod shape-determining protein MreC